MTQDGELRMAVIGAGHLGTYHARIYAGIPSVRLVGVVDIVEERARKLADETRSVPALRIADLPGPIHGVSVATPTSTHRDVAQECFALGCHVLVEKPLTASVEEGQDLVESARRRGLFLGVGHTERFNPAFGDATGFIREPRFIEAHRLAPFVPRSLDVDVVLDLMTHDIDLVLNLVGESVVQVDASGVGVLTHVEDIANARLRFEGGAVANLTASRISREKMRKIRLFGNGQYLSVDLLERQVQRAWLVDGEENDVAHLDPLRRIRWESKDRSEGNPLADELGDFVESIRQGKEPRVPGVDGLKVLDVALQVRAKVRESLHEIGVSGYGKDLRELPPVDPPRQ
jgi:predicted dehydrogenase